jgi:GDPmannose 4,6-dehydratase
LTRALITGITGQDGSLLAELLVGEGTEVVGITRGTTDPHDVENLAAVADRVALVHGDLDDPESLRAVVRDLQPDELYHLGAPTFVPASWSNPAGTFAEIAAATAAVLDASGDAHVVVAASSEVFGDTGETPQREDTPMCPRTPYGVAKLAALQLVRVYREQRGVRASAAITYNHESERRPERFVTRKVTRGAAAIRLGLERELVLGDLGAVRDWSAARDVVKGLRAMARQHEPDDYVLASGQGRTVGELVRAAFAAVELDPEPYLRIDPNLVRNAEETPPVGDPTKARERLGWSAETGFEELIGQMVAADLRRLGGEAR